MNRFAASRAWLLAGIAILAVVGASGAGALLSSREESTLDGLVVDPSGAPIPNAVVTGGRERATTDGSGRFRLAGAAGWVTVRADGWIPRTRTASPEGQVLIRLAPDTRGTVTFAFGGDVMFGRRYFDPDEDGSIDGLLSLDADVDDHVRLLDGVRPALSDADLTIVNLETPLSDDPYPDPRGPRPRAFHPTKDYVFASRPAAAGALAKVGIDVVGIANNHLFDQLAPGVASTRAALEAAGYQPGTGYFGAGAGEEEAWAPAIREVEGQRVAFVGCTSITGDEHPITYVAGPRKGGAARCEPARLRSQVARAAAGADIVVAMIHGGYEYGREPSGQVRALSDTAVSAGRRWSSITILTLSVACASPAAVSPPGRSGTCCSIRPSGRRSSRICCASPSATARSSAPGPSRSASSGFNHSACSARMPSGLPEARTPAVTDRGPSMTARCGWTPRARPKRGR
jgi:poly-gamma-glutamate synthesis protein (capsule biosynthesis protein)